MSSKFGVMAKNTIALKNLSGKNNESAGIEYRPLNEICGRYSNKYINNSDKAKSLEQSIRKNGLIEPIVIIDIDDYLSRNIASDDEKRYLLEKKGKGVKYFISAGHRRFKAYVSIALNRSIITNDDLNNFYDDFKKIFKDYEDEKEHALMNGLEPPEGKWFTIPSKVIKLNEINENAIYNDSNTTQRELTGFELVANTIDELKLNGLWDEYNEKVKVNKINQLKSKQLSRLYDEYRAKGVIDSIDSLSSTKTQDEKRRELLLKVSYKHFNNLDNGVNEEICRYIVENKQRTVSKVVVNFSRKILDVMDNRLIDCIYNGLLTFKDAKELLSIYNDLDIDEVLSNIKSNNFDIKKITNKKKTKVAKYTYNDLIELFYEIKNGSKTIDEVIESLERL